MSDRVISIYALDSMLAKLSGMYHIEDIRAMISKVPAAEIETEKPEWINVRDKVPQNYERVLVVVEADFMDKAIVFAEYHESIKDWTISGYGMLSEMHGYRLTHWMPLPAPPKVKDEK